MAGIMSATQRQSFALMKAAPSGFRQAANSLFCLGKGDNLRGACVATAFVLTVLGCLAPHVGALTLTACLLLIGTALALVASHGIASPAAAQFENVNSIPCDAPREPLASERPQRARTIQELLEHTPAGASGDPAHWTLLTSRMSHELRTPLNAVLGFSEMMQGEVFGPLGSQHYADYARNIHRSGRTLLKSAEDALAITNLLTRSVAKSIDPVASMHDGVAEALDFHAACLLDRGIDARVSVDPELEILVEAQTLRQIMINLLSEAVERAEPGSCIVLASEAFMHEVSISVCTAPAFPQRAGGSESFSLILSRTLALLSGARLEERQTPEGHWCVTVHFQRVAQRDFFAHTGH